MVQSGEHVSRRVLLRIVGTANLIFASVGLLQLLANVVGYITLPSAFLDKYGIFMRHRFPVMSIATVAFLVPLAYGGIGLLRSRPSSVLLCDIIFVTELFYFLVLLGTWNFSLSPFNPVVVQMGLFNSGLALQLVTAYPIVGLIIINLDRLQALLTLRT